ncbi:lasso peptide biosynthesis B2 protein [Altererythrobacter sp. MF3-039]|uniref:lasso peptide biosynthesis B2 protein n=1 Tax=Altererythrobacter sp. MF3-039 TaxID=3252901 RepID=UPI00390CCFCB
MGKFRTFQELDREEKIAAFEAALLLLVARVLVTLLPLKYWRAQFGAIVPVTPDPDAICEGKCRIVRRAIVRAMRNAPLDFICLPQALAARWMLARRGIESNLSIGALRADTQGPRLHAWLTSGGHWVTGDCDPAEFAPFRSD